MKKSYLIPETKVRIPSLALCQMQQLSTDPNNPADPSQPAGSKERFEEEEKGFGQYQW